MTILENIKRNKGAIAVLIDPDKIQSEEFLIALINKAEFAGISYFFIGGSTVSSKDFQKVIGWIKVNSKIPIVIFPGGSNQISNLADGILFLSLISGRNPDFLIGHQIQAANELFEMDIECIPTGYILIDGGKQSSVAYVSQTSPIPPEKHSIILNTAKAGILSGKKVLFLDAGSGAPNCVPTEVIKKVSQLGVPVIVGGGIRNIDQFAEMKEAGANLIVIGNSLESNTDFLLDIHSHLISANG